MDSDCMELTLQFLQENLRFLNDAIKPVKRELSDSGEFSFICYEESWSFGVHIDKIELAAVSKAKGMLAEGNKCSYSEIYEELNEMQQNS